MKIEIMVRKLIVCIIIFISFLSCSMLASNFNDENDYYSDIEDPDYSVRMPIGINLEPSYSGSVGYIFSDVMKTASTYLTYSGHEWNSGLAGELDVDINGYPTYLPQTTSDGNESKVRFLINNKYKGRYRIIYDGYGILNSEFVKEDSNGYYIDLNGSGGNIWINIEYSEPENYINNMHIISDEYGIYTNTEFNSLVSSGGFKTFHNRYLEGLEEFNCLRFMDWINTNGSEQTNWEDRKTNSYYTQGDARGVSFDYAIELCNELQADAWVCVPHLASDDYIEQMAALFYNNLDPGLKVYLEFSNEMWNWVFPQANYINENAPGHVNSYVSTDLASLGAVDENFPIKDAYMMARAFRIWESVYGSGNDRLIRVATGQQAWADNSGGILNYLFNTEGIGCDALAVGGYFYFSTETHYDWVQYGDNLSMEKIYQDTYHFLNGTSSEWTRESAAYANQYDVDFLIYEGGQHMQPYEQEEWSYNQQLYDFQIDSRMYDLYFHNFNIHQESEVDCKLFMAYSFLTERESKWGSWGHLENMEQIGTSYITAPKFKALIDLNK